MSDKPKIAIIGLGRWGKVLLEELILQCEVKYQCDSKSDLDQVFNDPEVETVFIATPTETHFTLASRALEAGKHVFLEKPGTTSSSNLEQLVKLSEGKNLKFAIGYEFPHYSAVHKLKELLKGQTITSIHFDWLKWGTFKDNSVTHLLCHEVSIMKHLGLTNLTPTKHEATQLISSTDIISTEFSNDQNIHITSHINRTSPIKHKVITVTLDKGGYILSDDELFKINTDSQTLDKIDIPNANPVRAEVSDFLSAIQENREPQSNGYFALDVFKTLEMVS